MPNCHRARVSGAKASSTSSVSLRRRGYSGSLPLLLHTPRDNRDTLVNAFTFTSNYDARGFDPRRGVPLCVNPSEGLEHTKVSSGPHHGVLRTDDDNPAAPAPRGTEAAGLSAGM